MKWDLVANPNFKGHVGEGREADVHLMMISSLAKQRAAAMDVMKMMISDDVQKMFSEDGRPSVLTSGEIQKKYAANIVQFKGKNIDAAFKTKPIRPHEVTPYDTKLRALVDNAKSDIAIGGKDLNTFVRDLQEKANKEIESMLKK
ncbi:hypothetical protein ACFFNY_32575 [Paenibacillus hodogayensis]|uniref:Uncharacterized protein n=1 Tax=Paenibacillus hodogayensis TaxID=279208 RepID=A0ABV5W7I0_9BACL